MFKIMLTRPSRQKVMLRCPDHVNGTGMMIGRTPLPEQGAATRAIHIAAGVSFNSDEMFQILPMDGIRFQRVVRITDAFPSWPQSCKPCNYIFNFDMNGSMACQRLASNSYIILANCWG